MPRNSASRESQPTLVSDYDSEAAQYTSHDTHAPRITSPFRNARLRDPDEINFSVIKRYVPALSKILAKAPSAYIYTFSHSEATWEKTSIEGSMFVCELTPSPVTGVVRHCIVVLNRKGMENLIIDSSELQAVEITDQFLLLTLRTKEELVSQAQEKETKTLGFFLTTNSPDEREKICELVKIHWEMDMRERESQDGREGMLDNFGDEGFGSREVGSAAGEGYWPLGRRITLDELFRRR